MPTRPTPIGAGRRPRAADAHGDDPADHGRGDVVSRGEHLDAVVDQRRDGARQVPDADQRAHREQDEDGAGDRGQRALRRPAGCRPTVAVLHGDERRDHARKHQRHLNRSVERVEPEQQAPPISTTSEPSGMSASSQRRRPDAGAVRRSVVDAPGHGAPIRALQGVRCSRRVSAAVRRPQRKLTRRRSRPAWIEAGSPWPGEPPGAARDAATRKSASEGLIRGPTG